MTDTPTEPDGDPPDEIVDPPDPPFVDDTEPDDEAPTFDDIAVVEDQRIEVTADDWRRIRRILRVGSAGLRTANTRLNAPGMPDDDITFMLDPPLPATYSHGVDSGRCMAEAVVVGSTGAFVAMRGEPSLFLVPVSAVTHIETPI